MRCDELAELTIDYVNGALGAEARRAADEHLATCPDCRAEIDALSRVWGALGRLPDAAPSEDLGARFRRTLDARRELRDPRAARASSWLARPAIQAVAAALILLVGIAAGVAIQRVTSAPEQDRTSDDGRREFVLLLYESEGTKGQTPADETRLVEEYSAWGRRLAGAGDLVGGEKLAADFKTIAPVGAGALTAAGAIGGFFVVKARSYEEAAAIARTCPHLAHGGTIEVRMIEPT
jgi:hypothetical protein